MFLDIFSFNNITKPAVNKIKKSIVKLLFRIVNILAMLTVVACKSGNEFIIFIMYIFSA